MKPSLVLLLLLPAAAVSSACSGSGCGGAAPRALTAADSVLLQPELPALRETPPDTFYVALDTNEGPITIEVIRAWAPLGAFRFYNLVRHGFYDGSRFFRVLPGFIAQFGANGHPAIDAAWAGQALPDDPVRVSNAGGTISFAMAGPATRVSQVFINYRDNPGLDQHGFAPFGRVIAGMDALLKLESGYGEPQPVGRGPSWQCIQERGNGYLEEHYPQLDYVRSARLVARP